MDMYNENSHSRNYVTISLLMAFIGLVLLVYMCASSMHLTKQYRSPSFQVEALR